MNNIITYAIKIVFRQKLRTILTSLGITISIVLLSLIIFGMRGLENAIVSEFTARFDPTQIIVSKTDPISGSFSIEEPGDKMEPVVITDKVIQEIANRTDVESVEEIVVIQGFQASIEGVDVKPLAPIFTAGINNPQDSSLLLEVSAENGELEDDQVFIEKKIIKYFGLTESEVVGKTIVLTIDSTSFIGQGAVQFKDAIDAEYKYEIVGVVDSGSDRFDLVFNLNGALTLAADFGKFESVSEYVSLVGYTQFIINAKSEDDVAVIADFVEEEYGLSPISSDQLVEFLGQITVVLTIVLLFFAGISSVVASIGIINTMVMSIYEQTKEIGIAKAIGASNRQILLIFLVQSGTIGFLGGLLGLLIVVLTMFILNPVIVDLLDQNGFVLDSFFVLDSETLATMAFIIVGSILVGILSGLYPAFKAAKLDPVKALRYE